MRTGFHLGLAVFQVLLVCFALQETESSSSDDSLRLVQVVFRHGDRSPLHTYPNDPYNGKDIWPEGKGQLTGKGKDQHFDLGQFFRTRYNGFLERIYNHKTIHVLSSDTDRTLMSAEANLAGLFPAIKNISDDVRLKYIPDSIIRTRVHDHINIQLVPIHTLSQERDRLLKMTAPCPRRATARHEFYKTSKDYQRVMTENQDFLRFLEQKSGLRDLTLGDLVDIHDPLFCQLQHNLPLPTWATPEVMTKLAHLRGLDFAFASPTVEVRRLYGGPLVKRLVENMLGTRHGTLKKPRKMFMHSAHDDTLAAVMSSFGVFDPQVPPFASALILELHHNKTKNDYYVEFFFKNSTDSTPHSLQVPGCGSPCWLNDLTSILEPVIPTNWEEECTSTKHHLYASDPVSIIYKSGYPTLLVFLVATICSSGFWIVILCYISKQKKRGIFNGEIWATKRQQYDPL